MSMHTIIGAIMYDIMLSNELKSISTKKSTTSVNSKRLRATIIDAIILFEFGSLLFDFCGLLQYLTAKNIVNAIINKIGIIALKGLNLSLYIVNEQNNTSITTAKSTHKIEKKSILFIKIFPELFAELDDEIFIL